eukprot:4569280-Prymnesium_polylepis.2
MVRTCCDRRARRHPHPDSEAGSCAGRASAADQAQPSKIKLYALQLTKSGTFEQSTSHSKAHVFEALAAPRRVRP